MHKHFLLESVSRSVWIAGYRLNNNDKNSNYNNDFISKIDNEVTFPFMCMFFYVSVVLGKDALLEFVLLMN